MVALAERFRFNSARLSAPALLSVQQQDSEVSISGIFYSAILQENSIIDSD
jgi:hypothetical protein